MSEAQLWQRVTNARPRPICRDTWTDRLLRQAVLEIMPVGITGKAWKFPDGSLLVSTEEWEQVK